MTEEQPFLGIKCRSQIYADERSIREWRFPLFEKNAAAEAWQADLYGEVLLP